MTRSVKFIEVFTNDFKEDWRCNPLEVDELKVHSSITYAEQAGLRTSFSYVLFLSRLECVIFEWPLKSSMIVKKEKYVVVNKGALS